MNMRQAFGRPTEICLIRRASSLLWPCRPSTSCLMASYGHCLAALLGFLCLVGGRATAKEPVALAGHTEAVWGIAFSPNSRRLVSCGDDRTVRIWDVSLSKECSSSTSGEAAYQSAAVSPDGKTLALGGGNGVRLRALDDAKDIGRFQISEEYVTCVRFSPNGQLLAVSSRSGRVTLYEMSSGRRRELTLGHHGGIKCVAFDSHGSILAAGYGDGTIGLWNIQTERCSLLEKHKDSVVSVAFAPDGKSLISGSWDGTLRLWDIATGRCCVLLRGENPVMSVAFSPDGSLIAAACSDDNTVKVYEASSQKLLTTLLGHSQPVLCVAFSPDGKKLASSGGNIAAPSQGGEIFLWDAPSTKSVHERP
jgi:WD40 repeat protein